MLSAVLAGVGASLFLERDTCTALSHSTQVEVGRGETKVVTLATLQGTPSAVKHLLPAHERWDGARPSFKDYLDLIHEAMLLQEVFETASQSAVKVHGLCDEQGDVGDFVAVEYALPLSLKDAKEAKTVSDQDRFHGSPLVTLFRSRGELALRRALEDAFTGLTILPSGPVYIRDVKWPQVGIMLPPRHRLGNSSFAWNASDPAEVARRVVGLWVDEPAHAPLHASVLDLGCAGRGGSVDETTKRNGNAVHRLMNELHSVVQAPWGFNFTEAEERAKRDRASGAARGDSGRRLDEPRGCWELAKHHEPLPQ